MTGISGTGKTFFSRDLVRDERRLIIVDPACEWGLDACIVDDWNTFFDAVQEPSFRLSVQIDDNPRAVLDIVAETSLCDEVSDCVLLIDELHLFFQPGERPSDIVERLFNFGRRSEVSVLMCAQRSYWCPITLRASLTDLYCFHSHEPADVAYIAKTVGDPKSVNRIITLPQYRHIHFDLAPQAGPENDPLDTVE